MVLGWTWVKNVAIEWSVSDRQGTDTKGYSQSDTVWHFPKKSMIFYPFAIFGN